MVVSDKRWIGKLEVRGFHRLEGKEYPGDLAVAAAERTQHQQVIFGLGKNHPFPAAGADE